ncbi:MAG TPA: polyhydroxyalkanoic acid system family protein [Ignavibacteria bacterium]
MPKLEIKIPHELTQTEALNRIQQFLPDLKAQHSDRISNLEESWSGSTGQFKFKIKGFKISGSLFVENNFVLINGEIPFLAAPFKGTIEETIKTKATELLGVK